MPQRAIKFPYVFFCLYLLVFPFCYFRHDDWLILGTAVKHMPEDWGLLWRATLYYNPHNQAVWFFRPVFKILTFLNYNLFGFRHSLWLIEQLVILLFTLQLATKSICLIRKSPSDRETFLVSFTFSVALHFGSLVWIGEGMMNIPQVFFLTLALYGFLKSSVFSISTAFLSLLGFVGALLCKESSVVFPGLLLLLSLNFRNIRSDFKLLALHFAFSLIYLFIRFSYFAINPGYHPLFDFDHFVRPLFLFLGACTLGPVVLFVFSYFRNIKEGFKQINLKCLFLFSCFIFLLILPHLGHWFFSPGWFFLPGFWGAWTFPLVFKSTKGFEKIIKPASLVIFVLSITPMFIQLNSMGWQHWGRVQKELHQIIESINPDEVDHIYIQECVNEKYPESDLGRVAGSNDSIAHIWSLSHDRKIYIESLGCNPKVQLKGRFKVIYYHFPEIELRSPNS